MESMKKNVITGAIILFFCSLVSVMFILQKEEQQGEILPSGATVVNEKATWKDDLIHLHNVYRQDNGLEPLHESEELDDIAKHKVDDLIESCTWSHYDNTGKFVSAEYAKTGVYNYVALGENLANGLNSQDMFTAWLNSTRHRDNILDVIYDANGNVVEDLHYGEIGIYIYPYKYTCTGESGRINFENLTAVIFGTEAE